MRNHLSRTWRGVPKLVRFFLCHAAIGFGVSAAFVGALILSNAGGAGDLLLGAAGHWWPAALLWLFTGMTFGAVQIGIATMLLDEPPRRRGNAVPVGLRPAVVRMPALRRR